MTRGISFLGIKKLKLTLPLWTMRGLPDMSVPEPFSGRVVEIPSYFLYPPSRLSDSTLMFNFSLAAFLFLEFQFTVKLGRVTKILGGLL